MKLAIVLLLCSCALLSLAHCKLDWDKYNREDTWWRGELGHQLMGHSMVVSFVHPSKIMAMALNLIAGLTWQRRLAAVELVSTSASGGLIGSRG